MTRTSSDYVLAATRLARMTQADLARVGMIHPTTLSRYISQESEGSIEPGAFWTLMFIEQLVAEYDTRAGLLRKLHSEAGELYRSLDATTKRKQATAYIDMDDYAPTGVGPHPATTEGWAQLFERPKKKGKKRGRKKS